MDKKDLIQQVKLYLKDDSVDPSINYDNEIIKFIDAFFLFNANTSKEIFLKTNVLCNSASYQKILLNSAVWGETPISNCFNVGDLYL